MRVLSPFARYSIQLFGSGEKIMQDPSGYAIMVPQQEAIVAMFDKLGLMPHEEDLVLKTFNFSGLPEGVHPLTRVGVFDTEAYCLDHYENEKTRSEMQVQIDNRFRELAKKFSPSQFIIVETPLVEIPWPTYDTDSVEDILKLQERLGFDAEHIRRYEQENQDRSEIVEAMSQLEGNEQEEEIEVHA